MWSVDGVLQRELGREAATEVAAWLRNSTTTWLELRVAFEHRWATPQPRRGGAVVRVRREGDVAVVVDVEGKETVVAAALAS